MISKKLKLKLGTILLGTIMLVGTACNQKDATDKKATPTPSSNVASEQPKATTESDNKADENSAQNNKSQQTNNAKSTDKSYVKAYLNTIEDVRSTFPDDANKFKYDLINFNDDDIPDLVIQGTGIGDFFICFYDGNKVEKIESWPTDKLFYHEKNSSILSKYVYDSDNKKILHKSFSKYKKGSADNKVDRTELISTKLIDNDTFEKNFKNEKPPIIDETPYWSAPTIKNGFFFGIDNWKPSSEPTIKELNEQEFNNKAKELSICTDENAYSLAKGTKSFEQIKQELQK